MLKKNQTFWIWSEPLLVILINQNWHFLGIKYFAWQFQAIRISLKKLKNSNQQKRPNLNQNELLKNKWGNKKESNHQKYLSSFFLLKAIKNWNKNVGKMFIDFELLLKEDENKKNKKGFWIVAFFLFLPFFRSSFWSKFSRFCCWGFKFFRYFGGVSNWLKLSIRMWIGP